MLHRENNTDLCTPHFEVSLYHFACRRILFFFSNPFTCTSGYRIPCSTFDTIYTTANHRARNCSHGLSHRCVAREKGGFDNGGRIDAKRRCGNRVAVLAGEVCYLAWERRGGEWDGCGEGECNGGNGGLGSVLIMLSSLYPKLVIICRFIA
jgi:hypothetical protein